MIDACGAGEHVVIVGVAGDGLDLRFDPSGDDTYWINRDLSAIGKIAGGALSLPRWDPVSHTFTAVTDKDGKVVHTYSWGNGENLKRWTKDASLDMSTAEDALKAGWAERVEDGRLDQDVDRAFTLLNRKENERVNGIVCYNCKTEAGKFVDTAKALGNIDRSRLAESLKDVAAAKGYDSVQLNSNGTVTGVYTPTGSRIPRKVTCDAHGHCTSN